MYQNIFVDKNNQEVHLWDDQSGYSKFPYNPYAYTRSANGKYKSLYGDSLEKIAFFDENDPTLFESDVLPEMRVLIDNYENSDDPSHGHNVVILDIEVDTEGGYPNVMLGDKTITAIALYNQSSDTYYSLILDVERKIKDSHNGNVITRSFRTEEGLLNSFLLLWEDLKPTIVSGWNSNYFDIPYLYNRIRGVLTKKDVYRLSPAKIVYQNKFTKKVIIAGISLLDYIDLYKKFLGVMKSSYSLANVAKDEELKHQKIVYKGSLNDLYKNDINRFIEYNLVDVMVVVELDKKYDFIYLARSVCHKGHVPYEWFQMSSRFIDGAILTYLRRNHLIAPNKPVGGREEYERMEEADEDGFTGAFVKEPIAGLYDWIYSADITSLYPSVIMSLNISPETKIDKIVNWNFQEFDDGIVQKVQLERGNILSADDLKKKMQNYSIGISSNGVMYSQPNRKILGKILNPLSIEYNTKTIQFKDNHELDEFLLSKNLKIDDSNNNIYKDEGLGVIPTILDIWFKERVQYRELAGKYAKAGDKEKESFFDRRQKRQKIFLNSVYGVMGLPIFRFYDRDNAEAVTISGQHIIRSAERLVNDYYIQAFKSKRVENSITDFVTYIDTDSLYISALPLVKLQSEVSDMTQFTIDTVVKISDKINTFYQYMVPRVFNVNKIYNRIKIVPDVIAKKALWVAKKRYAMLKVFDMEKQKPVVDKNNNIGKLEVKGIDTVRSSFPAAFKKIASETLENLLRGFPRQDLEERLLTFEETINVHPIFDLSKTSSVRFISKDGLKNYNPKNRTPFQFITGSPSQVKAALAYNDLLKMWELDKSTPKIENGQKVKWTYLMPNDLFIEQIAMKADDTDPDKILEFIEMYIDRKKMFTKELHGKFEEIWNVIGWQYPNRGSQLASTLLNFQEEW